MGGLGLCKAGEGIGQLWWDLNWAFMLDQGLYGLGTKPRFEPRGGESMNQKNFKWDGLLKNKKKNHGRQNNCTLLP